MHPARARLILDAPLRTASHVRDVAGDHIAYRIWDRSRAFRRARSTSLDARDCRLDGARRSAGWSREGSVVPVATVGRALVPAHRRAGLLELGWFALVLPAVPDAFSRREFRAAWTDDACDARRLHCGFGHRALAAPAPRCQRSGPRNGESRRSVDSTFPDGVLSPRPVHGEPLPRALHRDLRGVTGEPTVARRLNGTRCVTYSRSRDPARDTYRRLRAQSDPHATTRGDDGTGMCAARVRSGHARRVCHFIGAAGLHPLVTGLVGCAQRATLGSDLRQPQAHRDHW